MYTALSVLKNGIAFAYPGAFTKESWKQLTSLPSLSRIISVTRSEALGFGLNWVEVENTILLGREIPSLISKLKALGKNVIVTPLSQFQLAGGSAACLVAYVHPLQNNLIRLKFQKVKENVWTHMNAKQL